jgi:hypothetical protein
MFSFGGNMKLFLSLLVVLSFVQSAFAEENSSANTVTTKVAQPKWKSSFNSYFYDFEGTRAQKDNAYEFGDTTLKMQMMSLSYQLANGWTVMGLAQYYENNVVTKFGTLVSKDSSKGVADTLIGVAKPVVMNGSFMLLTDLSVSLPTGSIDEENPKALVKGTHYPYNMQMGSGTVDAVIGLTPLYFAADYQLGSRLSTILRTGDRNDNGYRLGNQYRLDAWVDVPMKYGFTPRVVGYYKYKDAIEGFDKTLGRNLYLEFYHHSQINWDVSAAVKYAYVVTPTFAVNGEAGIPMAQDSQNFDNVVVSTQYYVNLGVTGQF